MATDDRTKLKSGVVVTVQPKYGYPEFIPTGVSWGTFTTLITFLDPCETPTTLVKPTNLSDYNYYVNSGPKTFTFDAWTMTKYNNSNTACNNFKYTVNWSGSTDVRDACTFVEGTRTFTCESTNIDLGDMTANAEVTVKSPTNVDYGMIADQTFTWKPTFKVDPCMPLTSLTAAPPKTTTVVTNGPGTVITLPEFGDILPGACANISYTATIATNPNSAINDAITAAIYLGYIATRNILVLNKNALLNGVSVVVTVKIITPTPSSVTIEDAAFSSAQTITFNDGCEAPSSIIASPSVIADDYTLGSGASVSIPWGDFTATFPGTATPTCAWVYEIIEVVLTGAGALVIDTLARTVVVNASAAILV